MVTGRLAGRAACAASLCVLAATAGGGPAVSQPTARADIARDASQADDVADFFDEFFQRQMAELDIPGAVVVWVRDGAVRHGAAYGVADRENRTAVDYEASEFRIASVAKFFTALCALQLADAEKLDLQADINAYLQDMRVGRPPWGPITTSDLLVHTGGFDERMVAYLTRDPSEVAHLGAYLRAWMPPQTRRAGTVATYSNHGYALVGYLVERQTGMPFDQYANVHLFAPLGMDRTTFLVPPIEDAIAGQLCPGYWASGDRVDPVWSRPYPAGAVATTAGDMARFLVAFLRAAREPSQTLPQSIMRRVTQRHFSHRVDLPGYTLGLAEMSLLGQRVLLKGGAAPGHSAVVAFFPEHDAGLFVALNRQEPQLWTRLLPELAKHEFAPDVPSAQKAAPAPELGRFAGEYRLMRYADASFERLLSLAMHLRVTAEDGRLHVRGSGVELACDATAEPLVFATEPGRYVAFKQNDQGRISHLLLNIDGDHFAAERLAWREKTDTTAYGFLGACAVLLAAGVFQTAAFPMRRMRRGTFRPAGGIWAALLPVLAAATLVMMLAAFYTSLVPLTNLLYGPSTALWLALTCSNLLALLAVLLLLTATRRLIARDIRPLWRVGNAVLCLACVIVVTFLVEFNLIGFRV